MDKTPPLNQLIDSAETLIATNQRLSQINKENYKFIKELHERQERMLVCFRKLYKFINSKNEKTWEEHIYVNELFDLITHAKKDSKE